MSEKSLTVVLEETTKERRKGTAHEKDVHYANKLIRSKEEENDLDELWVCLNNVNIHGGFKPILFRQLKKVNPQLINN